MYCDVCGAEENNMKEFIFNIGNKDKATILLCRECNITYDATGDFPLTLYEIKQICNTR